MHLGDLTPLSPSDALSPPRPLTLPAPVRHIVSAGGIPLPRTMVLSPTFYGAIPGLLTNDPQVGAGFALRWKWG